VIMKYPVRAALNPFASTIGYLLPFVVSGSIVVSLVLSLPTVGPLLLRALVAQDMFLAGAIVLLARGADRHRHVPLRSHADVDRPAHSLGPARMSTLAPPAACRRRTTAAEEKVAVATQLQLTWWRFRRHKVAVASGIIVLFFYLVAVFADFLATTDPYSTLAARSYIPPQSIHWFDDDGSFRPHVFALEGKRDMRTFRLVYVPNLDDKRYLRLFAEGYSYRLPRAVRDQPAPDRPRPRCRRGGALPLGHRPARPGFLVAAHARDPHVLDDRALRRRHLALPRRAARRHLRHVWRLDRHRHPAPDRDPALDPDHPALDGPGRRPADRPGACSRSTSRSPSSSR
jgi:hypothetical protein